MSSLTEPTCAFLFASILFNKNHYNIDACQNLWQEFAGAAYLLEPNENPLKRYYSQEMGEEDQLQRILLLTPQLVSRDFLVTAKLWAEQKEQSTCIEGRRVLNIDPGLLTAENVILATGKNFGHRIYIGQGVYGDLTLMYQKGQYRQLPWSYPDYLESAKLEFFTKARQELLAKGVNSL